MKVLILGAAGQISKLVTEKIINETNHSVVLYARNATKRLRVSDPSRQTIIDGDFNDYDKLTKAMQGADFVYLNDMNSPEATENVVKATEASKVKVLVGASILGIYDEVVGPFAEWNRRMVGAAGTKRHLQSATVVENSSLDYTLLRLTWLYNQTGNEAYETTQKGEPYVGAQVTREAVARLVMDILANPSAYAKQSLGVVEPNTDFDKPSWY